jgi:electron transfer flavoprotein beta subunit
LNTQEIGLSGSPTQVRRIFAPEREKGEILMGEGENQPHAVSLFFDKLVEKSFLELK